jgi:hypothetical protein
MTRLQKVRQKHGPRQQQIHSVAAKEATRVPIDAVAMHAEHTNKLE